MNQQTDIEKINKILANLKDYLVIKKQGLHFYDKLRGVYLEQTIFILNQAYNQGKRDGIEDFTTFLYEEMVNESLFDQVAYHKVKNLSQLYLKRKLIEETQPDMVDSGKSRPKTEESGLSEEVGL